MGETEETIKQLQVRVHGNMDGSSFAHAIQVPMGPPAELCTIVTSEKETCRLVSLETGGGTHSDIGIQ